jgi:RES domain-containing protein
MVYCSSSLALAALEVLVHIDQSDVQIDLEFIAIATEVDDRLMRRVAPELWTAAAPAELDLTREIGGLWLERTESLCLEVPSVLPDPIVSAGSNILINPLHPDFGTIRYVSREGFRFDDRFFHRIEEQV